MKPRAGLIAGILLLILLPVALYAPLLNNEWVDDDVHYPWQASVHQHLADLPHLFTIDISKVWRMHHYVYDAYAGGSDYRPVGYLYFSALYPLFGMSAPAYRVANFIIYTLGNFLVLLFVYRLTQNRPLAWLTAVLFAVEFMRFEYMTVLSFQGGLVLVFYLVSALGYLAARTVPHQHAWRRWYGLSLLAAFSACFDYEIALSLPLALLVLEWYEGVLRRQWAFRPAWILPHGLIALFYVVTRMLVESRFYPEKGATMLRLTDPHDLLYAGIHAVSRVIMLFLPTFATLRQQAKVWVFGEVPGQTILLAHPGLALAAAGLLLAAVVAGAWLITRPTVRRFLWQAERGQWCLVASGWILVAMAPLLPINQLGSRYLVLAGVGSSLLKALVVLAVSDSLHRRWMWGRRLLYSLFLTPLVLYSMSGIVPEVQAWERDDRANKTLMADAIRLTREAAVDSRPMIVYYLNGLSGSLLFVGLQEVIQAALGREDIHLVVPYALPLRQALDEQFRSLPEVTIGHDEIRVVNTARPPQALGLVYYDLSAVKTGLTVRNGSLYTVEVLEADEVTHNLLRFVIRYARPEGARILFLTLEDGRLVRQDVD